MKELKTAAEYGEQLYTYYVLWKSYEGALKRDYKNKMKYTDALLQSALARDNTSLSKLKK